MSWSLTKLEVPRDHARAAFEKVFREQSAYANDGDHKRVMDECAEFAAKVAEGAPEGTVASIASYGHINSPAGLGQASITVTIGLPPVYVPPQPSPIDE